jgi:CRP-like cAMP-binding protein
VAAGFLGSLPPELRTVVEQAGRPRRYEKGDVVIREGDPSDSVVVLRRGWVKVSATTENGFEVVLCVRGPGDVIGELAAIDPRGSRSGTAVAVETVECRVIGGDEFRTLVADHGVMGLALLRLLIGRLRDADRRRVEFGGYSTARRLARVLVELVTEHGRPGPDGVELGIALSQEELAGLTASSRESVARALGALRSQGLVSTARRRLTVHDLDALRAYAG